MSGNRVLTAPMPPLYRVLRQVGEVGVDVKTSSHSPDATQKPEFWRVSRVISSDGGDEAEVQRIATTRLRTFKALDGSGQGRSSTISLLTAQYRNASVRRFHLRVCPLHSMSPKRGADGTCSLPAP